MTPFRVIAAALLLGVAAAVGVVPSERDSDELLLPLWSEYRLRSDQLLLHASVAQRAYSRTLAAQRPRRADHTLNVTALPGVDRGLTDRVEELASAWWALEAPPAPRIGVAVSLVPDTVVRALGIPAFSNATMGWDIFLPGVVDAATCHAVIRVPTALSELTRSTLDERVTALLAHCRWHLRYGPPGAGVDAWLASRQYAALHALAWQPWNERRRESQQLMATRACRGGRPGACEAQVLPPISRFTSYRGGEQLAGWFGTGSPSYGDPYGARLLTTLERQLGPDEMQRVWTSDAPFAETVERTLGRPIGEVALAMTDLRQWPLDGDEKLGPTPLPQSTLSALLAAALACGLGVWGFRRSIVAG